MALSASRVFYMYGAFLVLGGLLAFAMAGFEARAKTAILMGSGCGVVMMLVAYLGETRPLAIKIGRGLLVFFILLFSYRGYKIRDVSEKYYLFVTFCILVSGTAVALLFQAIAAGAQKRDYKSAGAKSQQD